MGSRQRPPPRPRQAEGKRELHRSTRAPAPDGPTFERVLSASARPLVRRRPMSDQQASMPSSAPEGAATQTSAASSSPQQTNTPTGTEIKRTLKGRFLQLMLAILVPLSLATLASLAFVHYRSMEQTARDTERLIRSAISEKGRVLTQNH